MSIRSAYIEQALFCLEKRNQFDIEKSWPGINVIKFSDIPRTVKRCLFGKYERKMNISARDGKKYILI